MLLQSIDEKRLVNQDYRECTTAIKEGAQPSASAIDAEEPLLVQFAVLTVHEECIQRTYGVNVDEEESERRSGTKAHCHR